MEMAAKGELTESNGCRGMSERKIAFRPRAVRPHKRSQRSEQEQDAARRLPGGKFLKRADEPVDRPACRSAGAGDCDALQWNLPSYTIPADNRVAG